MKRLLLGAISLVLIAVGLALIAYYFLNPTNPQNFNVPKPESVQQVQNQAPGGPEDKTLKVTIPAMARIEGVPVPDASSDDEEDKLKNYAAIHLQGTGFPWQEGANVYIAGHRLGYPGYPSFLAFYDLDKLKEGDEIFVEDANGRKYTYRVFRNFVANPTDLSVLNPVAGKSILTLQTCTLPDYSQRLIVQAELVNRA
jgi:sortase A